MDEAGGQMEDEEKKARRAVARSDWLIIAAIIFILLTTIAMILYPGSNNWTNQATHYSFAQNFFSDLGATRTYSDAANTASNVLFILALVLVGSGIAIFSFNSLVIAGISGKMRRLAGAQAHTTQEEETIHDTPSQQSRNVASGAGAYRHFRPGGDTGRGERAPVVLSGAADACERQNNGPAARHLRVAGSAGNSAPQQRWYAVRD